jgi:hypothetical protein
LVLSFTAPPVATAFILGLFWKWASATGAFVSLMDQSTSLISQNLKHTFCRLFGV